METYTDDDYLLSRGSQYTGGDYENGTLNTPRVGPSRPH